MKQKMIEVICDNSNVMSSIESASIEVKSPTGRSITLYKKHLGTTRCNQAMADVFWKCCKDPMVKFIGTLSLTKDEMGNALRFSEISYFNK